jgi:hypothetical protein
MIHELKTDNEPFQAVFIRTKTFEIRFNDRRFRVGDLLHLRETFHTGSEMKHGAPLRYSGREIVARVIGMMVGPVYGLADGWAILSIVMHERRKSGRPFEREVLEAYENGTHGIND